MKLDGVDPMELFTNGYFVDGFVHLTDADPNGINSTLTVPFSGFNGKWDQAPIIDPPQWDEANTYYGMTGLLTSANGDYNFLGAGLLDEAVDPEKIAISPNGDGVNDDALPILSFLRNAAEFQVNVVDKDGKFLRTIRNETKLTKNFYDNGADPEYSLDPERAWDGKVNGVPVADGDYSIELKAKIDFPGAQWQTVHFPVKVDNTKPVIKGCLILKQQKINCYVIG